MGTPGNNWQVACGTCGFAWARAGGLTDYERQALESRPCPSCGAYTLGCSEPRTRTARRDPRDAARLRRAA